MGERLDPDILSSEKVERLLRMCSRRAPTGIRNRAILTLAWRCGLRVSEILSLEPKDLDLDGGRITIRHGKGDRTRLVGADVGSLAVVGRWLEVRSKLGVCRRAPALHDLARRRARSELLPTCPTTSCSPGGDREASAYARAAPRVRSGSR